MIKLTITAIAAAILLVSCGGNELLIPKPSTYLRTSLPDHKYTKIDDECPYTFELSSYFSYTNVLENGQQTCHKDITLGPLNGIISFSYIEMERPLKDYVNYAIDKVEDHKVKASDIDDKQIIRPGSKVYGTFFELKGNVASPFQFYLTDSTDRFVSGVVYFNTRPNYDSLRPSLEYLKQDLMHLMETFEWKK